MTSCLSFVAVLVVVLVVDLSSSFSLTVSGLDVTVKSVRHALALYLIHPRRIDPCDLIHHITPYLNFVVKLCTLLKLGAAGP